MYCIEESICDIVGTFRRPPQWFSTRRIVTPLPPSLRPFVLQAVVSTLEFV